MGDQSLLKDIQCGKEYSSDVTGDGARTKRVNVVPYVNVVMIAKIKAMFLSFSTHVPSLLCRCSQCDTYLRWCSRTQTWNECIGTVCNVGSYVTCSVCYADADYNVQQDQWECPDCEPDVVVVPRSRKRRRPDYYRPS